MLANAIIYKKNVMNRNITVTSLTIWKINNKKTQSNCNPIKWVLRLSPNDYTVQIIFGEIIHNILFSERLNRYKTKRKNVQLQSNAIAEDSIECCRCRSSLIKTWKTTKPEKKEWHVSLLHCTAGQKKKKCQNEREKEKILRN